MPPYGVRFSQDKQSIEESPPYGERGSSRNVRTNKKRLPPAKGAGATAPEGL